jgi:phosphoribosylformimino-5-aminoimidazole carboxamide ribotide isomerase
MAASDFTVYPALDVLEGRCVRLAEGVRERVTIEGGDPDAAARRFVEEGARWLHLVDLDGAFAGAPTPGLVGRIAATGASLQVGGGYRTLDAIEAGLAAGATRVMVGTAAAAPAFLADAATRFGDRVVVAIDVKDGQVALRGWTDVAELAPEELARRCAEAGIQRLLVTNTRRDGSLAGPDEELLARVIEASGLPVIAAGGVASLDDLRALRELGCEGAIAGAALWSGRFTLAEALALSA